MALVLRTLTLKSKFGFGIHRERTPLDLIQQNKPGVLLQMYYQLNRIDFNADVKTKLCLTKELEIPKPGRLSCPEEVSVRIKVASQKFFGDKYNPEKAGQEKYKRTKDYYARQKKLEPKADRVLIGTKQQLKVKVNNEERNFSLRHSRNSRWL